MIYQQFLDVARYKDTTSTILFIKLDLNLDKNRFSKNNVSIFISVSFDVITIAHLIINNELNKAL